jgi:hypothetical protein
VPTVHGWWAPCIGVRFGATFQSDQPRKQKQGEEREWLRKSFPRRRVSEAT